MRFGFFILSSLLLQVSAWGQNNNEYVKWSRSKINSAAYKIEKIGLSKSLCTPFNLEGPGQTLHGVSFADQWFSNCYASGAANLVNAWITNKSDLPRDEILKSLFSPQHLSVAYALGNKANDFKKDGNADWSQLKGNKESEQSLFLKALSKKNKSSEDEELIASIAKKRFFYLEAGDARSSINNLKNYEVCSIQKIEKALGSEERGIAFFNNLLNMYVDFAQNYPFNKESDLAKHLSKMSSKLNGIYRSNKLSADVRITQDEIKNILFPEGKFELTDPLLWEHKILLSLCNKSQNPPKKLGDFFEGENEVSYPTPDRRFWANGPFYNRELIKAFFKNVGNPEFKQMPLAISYAGTAIWNGKSALAWKWDKKKQNWYHDLNFGGHQGIVVGRRWNEKKEYCEYQVRNSYSSSTTRGFKQDKNKYGVWIRDDYFYQSINWGYALKDKNGNY